MGPNPTITLSMPLDEFNKVQGFLSKHPFEDVAELVINFRGQVETQLKRWREQQQVEPPRLHSVQD